MKPGWDTSPKGKKRKDCENVTSVEDIDIIASMLLDLQHAPKKLRENREVALQAVEMNPDLCQYATE